MSASPAAVSPPTAVGAHERRKLGAPAITMIIIAASAPLTVIAGGSTTAYSVIGSIAVPVGYLVLAGILAIFAVGYAAMSRFITNAGAFYSYASQGLGRPVGVGVSLIALVAYNCMQIGIYGILGFQVSVLLAEKFGWDVPWWVGILVCMAIVGLLGINRVDLSAKVLGILVSLEFIAVIIFDVAAFANPAEGFTAAPISPSALLLPGIGAVLVFGIAAFMGFESAAIYGEEAKDPKRTVARATYAAVVIIGVFYALSSWSLALAIGPETITSGGITVEEAGPPLFFNFVYTYLGPIMVDFMSILFITSLFASLVSFHNAVARYFFALGREGVLPSVLARVRPRTGAPWVGSVTQTVLALIVVVLFAVAGADSDLGVLFPVVTLFTWLTNTGALGLVLLMAVVSLSVIGYFRRDKRDAGLWSRVIAPTLAFLSLTTVLALIVINFTVLLGQTEPDATTFVLPGMIIAAGIVGVVWGLLMRRTRPEAYKWIGHGSEEPAAEHLGA